MNCLSLLLILFCSFNPESQADALLEIAAQPELFGGGALTFDNSGRLWMIGNWKAKGMDYSKTYALRIKPNGKLDLDKVLVYDTDDPSVCHFSHGHQLVCDNWNNLYFGFVTMHRIEGTSATGPSTLHLIRVSPQGEIRDYHPWPQMSITGSHIEMLHGDTLLLLGEDTEAEWTPNGRPLRLSKALLESNGITSVYEKTYPLGSYPRRLLSYPRDYKRKTIDWQHGFGFYAYIRVTPSVTGPPAQPDKLQLYRFDMRATENAITEDSLGIYSWRDYVWRSYSEAPIGWLTFASHKDGGYVLCVPDPENRSTTHLLRLDRDGEPVDPATLDEGGSKLVLDFDQLPPSAKPHFHFEKWSDWSYIDSRNRIWKTDSANVLFWGCDNEGNLYSYRQFRKYSD